MSPTANPDSHGCETEQATFDDTDADEAETCPNGSVWCFNQPDDEIGCFDCSEDENVWED